MIVNRLNKSLESIVFISIALIWLVVRVMVRAESFEWNYQVCSLLKSYPNHYLHVLFPLFGGGKVKGTLKLTPISPVLLFLTVNPASL